MLSFPIDSPTYGAVKIAVLRGPSALQSVKLIDSISRGDTHGISVSIYDEPMQILSDISSGGPDYATLPVSMDKILGGKGFSIAAVTAWGGLFLCGGQIGIPASGNILEGLRGKTVHTLARGMAPDILLRILLAENGLAPDKDVFFDYSFPSHAGLLKAAIEGKTSLCVLPEPLLSQALNANPGLHIVSSLADEWKKVIRTPLPVTALFRKNTLEGNDMEASVLEAMSQSSQWVNSHPADAATLAVRHGINPDFKAIESSVARSAFDIVPIEDAQTAISHYHEALDSRGV